MGWLRLICRILSLLGQCCAAVATAYAAQPNPSALGYEWGNVAVGAGGFAPNIIFSRAEPDLAYLRTDMGGAYRWDSRAQRWIPLQDGTPVSSYLGVESLAADPIDPDVVYLAAGMGHWGKAAIWRSADRGAHWRITPVSFKMGGNEDGRGLGERLAIDPTHTSTLFFGSRHDGLWQSGDSGATWRKVESFPHKGLGAPRDWRSHGGVSFVLFDPKRRGTIYAAVADPAEQHLFRSTDGGISWTPVAGGPAASLFPVKGEIDGEGNLYVDYASGIGPNGIQSGAVWRLDTRSGEWTDITPSPGTEGGYMGLSVDRSTPGRLAVSSVNRWHPGDTVWVSADYGRHWTDLEPRSRRDLRNAPWLSYGEKDAEFGHWTAGLAIDPFRPGTIAYTTGATLYRTDEALNKGTIMWRPWVQGIEQTAVITLTSPTGGAHLISGFGDIGGFVHDRLDVVPAHIHLNPHHSNTNNLDYAGLAPNIVVRSGSQHKVDRNGAFLAWSEDGGRSWKPLMAPAIKVEDEPAARYDINGDAPIRVSADGGTFLVDTLVVLATTDRGKSWFAPTGLPADVRTVADKADPNLFYAVDFEESRLYVSRDGARSFEPAVAKGLPEKFIRVARTDREAQPALVATPGSAGDLWFVSGHRLYRSKDAGDTFQLVSPDDFGVELFGLGKAAPGRSEPVVYAIGKKDNFAGVWRSDDGGRSWLRINNDQNQWGLRFRAISGDPRLYGRVYIATDGRGIVYGDAPR